MIDTVKIRLLRHSNEFFYQNLVENCNNIHVGFIKNNSINVSSATQLFTFTEIDYLDSKIQIINGKIFAPSHNYHVLYRVKDDCIDFEFSIPKYFYGSNFFQLINHNNIYDQDYYKLFYNSVKKFFNLMPFGSVDFRYVLILRYDVCFNQFYEDEKQSKKALEFFKLKNVAHHDRKDFKTGLSNISRSSYNKIYHKGDEILKHEKNKIVEHPYYNNILGLSSRVLRYEQQYKSSNLSPDYMRNFSKYKHLYKLFLLQKRNGKIDDHLIKIFVNTRIKFSLDKSPLDHEYTKSNVFHLDENFFNYTVKKYLNFIKENYSLRNNTTTHLTNEIYKKKTQIENKTMKVRILSLIKTFGSLDKAKENKCISDSTYKRYKNFLKEKNLSDTKININIKQDFTHETYLTLLRLNNINMNSLCVHF